MALAPDVNNAIDADQQLLIYPTSGVDANHLHLTSGNLYNTELFLGNDNLYVKLANTGNVVVNSNDDTGNSAQWTFGTSGNLTLPMGGVVYETNIPDGGLSGSAIALKPTGGTNADQELLIYPTVNDANHLHLTTGNLYNTELFLGDDNLYVKLANTGNIVINTNDNAGNSAQWTFNNFGTLTLPGGSRISPLGANLDIVAGTGSYVNLTTSDESSSVGVDNGGGYIATAGGQWLFGTTGNLTAPGNISTSGNVIAGNVLVVGSISPSGVASPAPSLSGFSSVSAITVTATGNVTGGNIIATGGGTIRTDGNVNGNVFNGNVAFGAGVIGGSGNITGGNILTTGIVSATGNITAANFFGNGNTLSNVATQVASSWTVPVGNSTQSFTVPINNTYQLWVLGNIPNGIIVWNATGTVTNTNVPVIGQQFAWNYEGGGNILMFNSIPNQIIGTAGAIANAQPAVANTNVFSFGINNASGNTITVEYGWVKIS
jgi:hypothetical protein